MDLIALLAKAEPTFDAWYFVALLSRVTHMACAATLLGGIIYLRFVLAPSAPEYDREAALYAGRRKTWAMCVAVCTALLLVSGLYNLFAFLAIYKNLPALYHPLFGVKFLLAVGVFAIMALLAGRTSLAEKLRGSLKFWLNVALVMALGVYVTGAMLRSFRDLPDARVAAPTIDEAPSFGDDLIEVTE